MWLKWLRWWHVADVAEVAEVVEVDQSWKDSFLIAKIEGGKFGI